MNRLDYSKSRANLDANPSGFSVIGRIADYRPLMMGFVEHLVGKMLTQTEYADLVPDDAALSALMSEGFASGKLKPFSLRGQTRKGEQFFTDPYDVEYMQDLKMTPDYPFYYRMQGDQFQHHYYELPTQLGLLTSAEDPRIWVSYQYIVQMPGQYQPNLVDELQNFVGNDPDSHYNAQPELLARYEIMLTPWENDRQFRSYNGNKLNWQAGDVIYYPWRNTMHSHVNNSSKPIIWLQVTGFTKPEALAVQQGKDQLFSVSY